jgi:raffinose/stachyose/melibiose transport system substrate-binding protein
MELVWEAFEAANPHIRVELINEFEESFHDALAVMEAAGNLPDVIHAWPSGRTASLHENRLLLDLAPFVARDGLAPYFTELALDPSGQIANYLGIIPQAVTTSHAMWVNMEVLQAHGFTAPARTYSELLEQSRVLSAAGVQTIMMRNMPPWVMQSTMFSMIAGRFMGDDWHQDILFGEITFEDPAFVAALMFIEQMYRDEVISPSTLFRGYVDDHGPIPFARGQAAYFIDGDWVNSAFITNPITNIAVIPPERQHNFRITVFPEIDITVNGVTPALPGRTTTSVLATGWGINAAIAEDTEGVEAAWELVKWLTGREVQTFRINSGGFAVPSRIDLDPDALNLEPIQVAMANLSGEFDKATVVVDGVFHEAVFGPLNDGLQGMALGQITPQQVAANMQAAFDLWQVQQDDTELWETEFEVDERDMLPIEEYDDDIAETENGYDENGNGDDNGETDDLDVDGYGNGIEE